MGARESINAPINDYDNLSITQKKDIRDFIRSQTDFDANYRCSIIEHNNMQYILICHPIHYVFCKLGVFEVILLRQSCSHPFIVKRTFHTSISLGLSINKITYWYKEIGQIMISEVYLPISTPTILPLSSFVAHSVVDAAIRENRDCPITLEPIASLPRVCVPPCGHVCSIIGSTKTTCPICQSPCVWTFIDREITSISID